MKFTIQQIREMADTLANMLRADVEDYVAFVDIGNGWYAIAEEWEDVYKASLIVDNDGNVS